MFEGLTSTGVLIWIVGWLFQRYVMPYIIRSDKVKKAIKVVDQDTDIVDSGDPSFDFRTAPLTAYRPFKPMYYVTMGITRTKESEYLKIENTYADSVAYRRKISESEPEETCLISHEPAVSKKVAQATDKAIEELYDYVVQYMLKKYQMYFVATGNIVTNLITNDEFPRYARKRNTNTSVRDLLKVITRNVEEDFLLLQIDPKASAKDGTEYELRALTGIAANGFRSSEKLNKRLTDIHGPVPQYLERLQLSMNRHFSKIQSGQFTQRLTWGIQIGGGIEQTYRPSGNHLKPQEEAEVVNAADLDFTKDVVVRVERQVLTRLHKSGFVVLSVHTYMYPLSEIKQEGNAPLLAKAIRAWPEDVAHYKGRPRWGDAVLGYLSN